jgi:uncharacterized protein (TIGR00255 family)
MAIESMTGFARAAVTTSSGAQLVCEIRSVNGKSLDVRLRLPNGMDRIELPARQLTQTKIGRGNLQINVALEAGEAVPNFRINETIVASILALSARLETSHALAKPSIAEILSVRGVLDAGDNEDTSTLDGPVVAVITKTLDELKSFRAKEGAALIVVLRDQINQIEILVEQAQADPCLTVDAIRERLAAQVKLLMESTQGFDEQRLTMEAALLATKADVREELDRLRGHIEAVRILLGSVGPVGRKLDFLAQEFNREVNTLCSKSNAASITAIGLDLKAVVDQFREQVQNLE